MGRASAFGLGDLSVSRYGARYSDYPFLRSSIGASGPIFFVPGNPGDCARSCRRMLQVYISFYIENSGLPKWLVFSFSFRSYIFMYVWLEKRKKRASLAVFDKTSILPFPQFFDSQSLRFSLVVLVWGLGV